MPRVDASIRLTLWLLYECARGDCGACCCGWNRRSASDALFSRTHSVHTEAGDDRRLSTARFTQTHMRATIWIHGLRSSSESMNIATWIQKHNRQHWIGDVVVIVAHNGYDTDIVRPPRSASCSVHTFTLTQPICIYNTEKSERWS